MSNNSASRARVVTFNAWWRNNRNNTKAFLWLTAHAKRIAYAYNLPPFTFDEITTINKRYLHSTHKRMNRSSAWKLWKFIHPLSTNRIQRIIATGEHLMMAKHNKSTVKPKKEVTVVYKTKKRLTDT